jgi:RNA polymerase sigma-70 factor, ECF subfamily
VERDVSQLLARWSAGDPAALEHLMPIVYDELRRLSRSVMRRGGGASVLQPTALVHEAWLRLSDKQQLSLETRLQFYALAVKMMREILVDHSRRRNAAKRGGSQVEVPFDDAHAPEKPRSIDFLVLDDAITRLGDVGPRYPQIVELRYIAGLTIEETAELLNVSHATIEREWKFARLWLRRELQPVPEPARGKDRQ